MNTDEQINGEPAPISGNGQGAVKAVEIIRREYGSSKNFMTPRVLRVGKINKRIAYELSTGSFENTELFGVSVVEIGIDGRTIRRTDLSEVFSSQEEAESYIDRLKKEK